MTTSSHRIAALPQRALATALLCCCAATSQAALELRVGGYYDTVLGITWLDDANGVAGTPQDDGLSATDGFATWGSSNTWVSGLVVQGVGGWRLPTYDTTCLGYNCSAAAGELGYMFYANLGGIAGSPVAASPFSNLVAGPRWSSLSYPLDPDQAGAFDFADGRNDTLLKAEPYAAAWAVHDGDVLAVPEPESAAMLMAGLAIICSRVLRERGARGRVQT